MNDVFSGIEYEDGEQELWRGEPGCPVSPLRWWYLFPLAAAAALALAGSLAGVLPIAKLDDFISRLFLGAWALGSAAFPFLLARRTNSAQYLITDRRAAVHAKELFSYERSVHAFENAYDCKLEPMHNGLATLRFTIITHKRFGKREVEKVLLYAIPAGVAEELYALLGE